MPINFPNSPALNDQYENNGVLYIWDGVKWILATSPSSNLGSAAFVDIPVLGDAATNEIVLGNDSRLSDARAPTAHSHPLSELQQSGAATGEVPTWNGSEWAAEPVAGVTSSEVLPIVGNVTNDVSGFPNRSDTSLSFSAATRTVSLIPLNGNAKLYHRGTEYPLTTTLSCQWADSNGGRYIIFDPVTATLIESGSFPDIRSGQVLVAYVYWNVSSQVLVLAGDERHGSYRDTQWHFTQHRDVGGVWRSGGGITYTLEDDTNVGLGIATPMIFADEDLEHTVTHSDTPTNPYAQRLSPVGWFPYVWLNGTTMDEVDATSTFPYPAGTTRALYNPDPNGVGSLVEVPSGKYINYWIIATNDTQATIKLVLGRRLWDTEEAAADEVLQQYGLPFAEMAIMYRVVAYVNDANTGNAAKIKLVSVINAYRSITGGVTAVSATSHDTLADRTTANQHPIGAITNLQTTLDAKSAIGHGHALTEIAQSGATTGQVATWNGTQWAPVSPTGTVVKMWSGTIGSISTSSTIPWDNTTPTSTEGTQIFTVTVTPSRTDTVFQIVSTNYYAHTNRDAVVTAVLFRGTTALDAKPSNQGQRSNTNVSGTFTISYVDLATRSNLNPITYAMRAGGSVAGTTYINQGTSGQAYGGIGTGSYIIYEVIRSST